MRKLNLSEPENGYPEDTIFCSKVVNGYSQVDTMGLMELLEEKKLTNILHDYTVSGDVLSMPGGATIKIISPGEKELRAFVSDWTDYSVEPHEKEHFMMEDSYFTAMT